MNSNDLRIEIRRSPSKPVKIRITHKPSNKHVAGEGRHEARLMAELKQSLSRKVDQWNAFRLPNKELKPNR